MLSLYQRSLVLCFPRWRMSRGSRSSRRHSAAGATRRMSFLGLLQFSAYNTCMIVRGHARGRAWSCVVLRGRAWSCVVVRGRSWSCVVNDCSRAVQFLSIPPFDASLFLYIVTNSHYNKKLVPSYFRPLKSFLL